MDRLWIEAGAGNRQAKKAPRYRVHAIMAFVSAGDFVRAVVVIPRTQTKARRHSILYRIFESSRSPANCARTNCHRKIVVEGLDPAVAIGISAGIRPVALGIRIQTTIIVFAITRDVQPDSAPSFAIVRRLQQTVHHLREGVG